MLTLYAKCHLPSYINMNQLRADSGIMNIKGFYDGTVLGCRDSEIELLVYNTGFSPSVLG